MAALNEYECEMLDVLLEAFGVPDSLTREQLLKLFGGDEATAYGLVQVLIREELIVESGKNGPYELAERLILKPKGEKLLREGGFTARYHREQDKPLEVGGAVFKLQQQIIRLENDKSDAESELRDLKHELKKQQWLTYLWWALIAVALILGFWLGHHYPKK